MKNKFLFLLFLLVVFMFFGSNPVFSAPYSSYTYNYWGNPVPAPQAYTPSFTVEGPDLGVELDQPRDFIVSKGEFFILDTGNNRIIVADQEWEIQRIIDGFTMDGEEHTFSAPEGLYISGENVYVADTQNQRVIQLDRDGRFRRLIEKPEPDVDGVIPEDFRYRPRKVGVDPAGRIYVLAEGVYDGIMEFDVDGDFRGFIGAPRIAPSVADYLWYRIATEAQRQRMRWFLPTEYSSLDIDERGFLYTTVAAGAIDDSEAVRRLNASGDDVLRRMGFVPPVGDYNQPEDSRLVDIVAREFDKYSILDRTQGRVFTYDANGNLLYVFGGRGNQKGTFRRPAALDMYEDYIVVLDSDLARFTFFEPTEYAESIHAAIYYYNTGLYDRSSAMWRRVLTLNANYHQAYTGIGRALLRQDRFWEAMHNFRLGQNRRGYSEAFSLYRRQAISENFSLIMLFILLILLSIIAIKRFDLTGIFKERIFVPIFGEQITEAQAGAAGAVETAGGNRHFIFELASSLKYSLHVILHPFDGFWDLKHEKRGNIYSSSVIILLVIVSYVIVRQHTGFIFNPWDITELNIYLEAATVLLPFVLWCAINWALTTLMDGKGTFGEICVASAYALTPIILLNIPLTVISNYLIMEEAAFYYFPMSLGVIWAMFLLFFGTMTTHDYDIPKTLFVSVLIVVGIGVALFLGLLFLNIMSQAIGFFMDIYYELAFRM